MVGSDGGDGLAAVLAEFGLPEQSLLGYGGEARVYAIDEDRVLRVLHPGNAPDGHARQALVRELGQRGSSFLLPEMLSEGEFGGRHYSIERRLPGRSVAQELDHAEGAARVRLIEEYLAASAALGSLQLAERSWFGELLGEQPLRCPTWRGYLRARAAQSLARSADELALIDPATVTDGIPEVGAGAFVHLDAYAGNMLAAGGRITAVLDIGATSVAGDRRFDPVASAVYLSTPLITPSGRPSDIDVAHGWLRAAGLADLREPIRRWLAAFWAIAVDDAKLHRWCRSVLLPGA